MKLAVIFVVILGAFRYVGSQSTFDIAVIFALAFLISWVAELEKTKQTLEKAAEELEMRGLKFIDVVEYVAKAKDDDAS